MSVRQAQSEISSKEFAGWLAFYQLEPFGDLVADRRHAVAVQTFANAHRDPKHKPEPYQEHDFIRWGDLARRVESSNEPILLDDPEAQSALIKARIFGVPGTQK
ncbi:hypothetical protein ABIC71_000912 [Herbaspirillum seropedicae]|uniref:phage tail assembly protein T n=1 Tax=Herbaspirillum seropedicae TaxID=964 RepID=UPI003391A5D9